MFAGLCLEPCVGSRNAVLDSRYRPASAWLTYDDMIGSQGANCKGEGMQGPPPSMMLSWHFYCAQSRALEAMSFGV